ncbi:MAG: ChpI protein [Aridibacter sp.]|jgi:metal-responsive CopG/Arc/MetJ family transcriptional regulator
MKTAISIKDDLFQRAEKFAKEEKLSRSQLYSDALKEYLKKREKDKLIAKINEVCEKVDTSLDPFWKEKQARILSKDKW